MGEIGVTRSLSFALSEDEMIMTPATLAGSEASLSPSVSPQCVALAPKHRRWSTSRINNRYTPGNEGVNWVTPLDNANGGKVFGRKRSSSQSSLRLASQQPKAHKAKGNLFKRAVHKLQKRTSKRLSRGSRGKLIEPAKPKQLLGSDQAGPNIESLGIEPRLLEKWKTKKELLKQEAMSGGGKNHKMVSRGTVTLVIIGLLEGSYAWMKCRSRRWMEKHGIVLAALIVALAISRCCMLILDHCT